MASPTLSGKHSHRGVVANVVLSVAGSNLLRSGHCLIVAHPFWREPRAPVLLYLTPALTFGGGAIGVAPTHGPRSACCACCNMGRCLGKQASNMLAVHLVLRHHMDRGFATSLLQHGPAFGDSGASQALHGPQRLTHFNHDWQTQSAAQLLQTFDHGLCDQAFHLR
jgi:hypothetical protein